MREAIIDDPGINLVAIIKRIRTTVSSSFRSMQEEWGRIRKNLRRGPRILVINPSRIGWCGLNYKELELALQANGIITFPVLYDDHAELHRFVVNCSRDDLRFLTYKGVNLYWAAIYSACVELEVTPDALNLQSNQHLNSLQAWMSQAAHYRDFIDQEIEKYRPTGFLYVQGYFHDTSVARQLAASTKISLCSLENTFSDKKLIWEPISGISVNRTLARNYYWKFQHLIQREVIEDWYSEFQNTHKFAKSKEHVSSDRKFNFSDLKVITFIGQVYTDSSNMFGLNRGFKDQIEIIMALKDYAERNNCFLFVKLHPKEKEGLDSVNGTPLGQLTWRKLQPYCESPYAYIDKDNLYDTFDAIENSDVVVTINSQAGLESLIYDVPVILCGDAFYGGLGLTHTVHDLQSLEFVLNRELNGNADKFDLFKVKEFLYIYLEKYCIEKSEKALAKKLSELMCHRLLF